MKVYVVYTNSNGTGEDCADIHSVYTDFAQALVALNKHVEGIKKLYLETFGVSGKETSDFTIGQSALSYGGTTLTFAELGIEEYIFIQESKLH